MDLYEKEDLIFIKSNIDLFEQEIIKTNGFVLHEMLKNDINYLSEILDVIFKNVNIDGTEFIFSKYLDILKLYGFNSTGTCDGLNFKNCVILSFMGSPIEYEEALIENNLEILVKNGNLIQDTDYLEYMFNQPLSFFKEGIKDYDKYNDDIKREVYGLFNDFSNHLATKGISYLEYFKEEPEIIFFLAKEYVSKSMPIINYDDIFTVIEESKEIDISDEERAEIVKNDLVGVLDIFKQQIVKINNLEELNKINGKIDNVLIQDYDEVLFEEKNNIQVHKDLIILDFICTYVKLTLRRLGNEFDNENYLFKNLLNDIMDYSISYDDELKKKYAALNLKTPYLLTQGLFSNSLFNNKSLTYINDNIDNTYFLIEYDFNLKNEYVSLFTHHDNDPVKFMLAKIGVMNQSEYVFENPEEIFDSLYNAFKINKKIKGLDIYSIIQDGKGNYKYIKNLVEVLKNNNKFDEEKFNEIFYIKNNKVVDIINEENILYPKYNNENYMNGKNTTIDFWKNEYVQRDGVSLVPRINALKNQYLQNLKIRNLDVLDKEIRLLVINKLINDSLEELEEVFSKEEYEHKHSIKGLVVEKSINLLSEMMLGLRLSENFTKDEMSYLNDKVKKIINIAFEYGHTILEFNGIKKINLDIRELFYVKPETILIELNKGSDGELLNVKEKEVEYYKNLILNNFPIFMKEYWSCVNNGKHKVLLELDHDTFTIFLQKVIYDEVYVSKDIEKKVRLILLERLSNLGLNVDFEYDDFEQIGRELQKNGFAIDFYSPNKIKVLNIKNNFIINFKNELENMFSTDELEKMGITEDYLNFLVDDVIELLSKNVGAKMEGNTDHYHMKSEDILQAALISLYDKFVYIDSYIDAETDVNKLKYSKFIEALEKTINSVGFKSLNITYQNYVNANIDSYMQTLDYIENMEDKFKYLKGEKLTECYSYAIKFIENQDFSDSQLFFEQFKDKKFIGNPLFTVILNDYLEKNTSEQERLLYQMINVKKSGYVKDEVFFNDLVEKQNNLRDRFYETFNINYLLKSCLVNRFIENEILFNHFEYAPINLNGEILFNFVDSVSENNSFVLLKLIENNYGLEVNTSNINNLLANLIEDKNLDLTDKFKTKIFLLSKIVSKREHEYFLSDLIQFLKKDDTKEAKKLLGCIENNIVDFVKWFELNLQVDMALSVDDINSQYFSDQQMKSLKDENVIVSINDSNVDFLLKKFPIEILHYRNVSFNEDEINSYVNNSLLKEQLIKIREVIEENKDIKDFSRCEKILFKNIFLLEKIAVDKNSFKKTFYSHYFNMSRILSNKEMINLDQYLDGNDKSELFFKEKLQSCIDDVLIETFKIMVNNNPNFLIKFNQQHNLSNALKEINLKEIIAKIDPVQNNFFELEDYYDIKNNSSLKSKESIEFFKDEAAKEMPTEKLIPYLEKMLYDNRIEKVLNPNFNMRNFNNDDLNALIRERLLSDKFEESNRNKNIVSLKKKKI